MARRFTYSNPQITKMLIDQTDFYTWIGFEKDTNNICHLKKFSSFQLDQLFFDLELSVDAINGLTLLDNDLYVAVDDTVNILYSYNKNTPLSVSEQYTIPVGITESPVDITNDGTYVYVLIPGSAVLENAKILEYDDGVLTETIDLATVTDAESIAIDSNGEIQVVTYTDPATIVRVYKVATVWNYQITTIS